MSAIAILAQYRAKKIVKEQLRAKGIKVHTVSPRNIQILARLWLEVHRDEAVADAKEMISKSPELTRMYEREQRQRAKLLTFKIKASQNQLLRLCRC